MPISSLLSGRSHMPVPVAVTPSHIQLPDARNFDETWNYISAGLDLILHAPRGGMTKARYIGLHTAISNFCTHNDQSGSAYQYSEALGSTCSSEARIYRALMDYLREYLGYIHKNAAGMSGMTLLAYYSQQWDYFSQSAKVLNNVFNSINRHYVARERDQGDRGVQPVHPMALSQWRDVVLYGMEDAAQLPYNISKLINEERDGLIVDSFTIKKAIDSLIALGFDSHNLERQNLDLYRKTFLASFLQETCNYYVAESLQYLSENSVVDYVDKVTLRLSQEDGRARTYLHPSSHKEHLSACRHALVATQLATLQSEFGRLLDVEDAPHLRKMYDLLMAIPDALEPLQKQFYSFIRARGEAGLVVLYSDGQALNPTAYVLLIVGLHEHFKELVQKCFHNDSKFLEAMGKACYGLVNNYKGMKPSKSAELVAKFTDDHFRKGVKSSEAMDPDTVIDKAMVAFSYLQDRDVFQNYYTRGLARRLLLDAEASREADLQMISRLKIACGAEYTARLQKMMQDIVVSEGLNEDFQRHMQKALLTRDKVDFSALVVSSVSWPFSGKQDPYRSPAVMRKLEDHFKIFYKAKFEGRIFQWLPKHSRTELRMTYTATKHILTASAYQASILLQFNESDSLTYEDLQAGNEMDDDNLKANLDLLLKQKILLKEDETTYELNRNFRNPKVRIKINTPTKVETRAEQSQVEEQTVRDRLEKISLSIVRIMKARKTLTHSQLVNETIDQLSKHFTPQVSDIKRQIDDLIGREYLERGQERGILHYLA